MKRILIAMMLLASSLVAAENDDTEAELKKLEGNWQLTRQEERGALTPKPVVANLRIVIEGNEMAWYIGNPASNQTADLKVDPTTNPKSIDAEITKNSAIGKTMLGIYKLDKDTLEICWGDPGSEKRPKKFTTRPGVGSGSTYTIYKREKEK
jgi:uncharacterized protein (TIGR03067 family)